MPHHPAHESSGPLPAAQPPAAAVEMKPGQTLVFFGDSITAARPGYVDVLDQALNQHPLRLGLKLINAGVPGDTVRDLQSRLQPAVLAHAPDWVFVLIGANDLIGATSGNPRGVPIEEFERRLDWLVAAIASTSRVILLTLTLVGEELEDAIAARIKEYNQAIKRVAERHALPLIDLNLAFRNLYDRAATYKQQVTLTSDGVHPDSKGHALIARTIIAALGVIKKN